MNTPYLPARSFKVYAAQPREGTETTLLCKLCCRWTYSRFMQLNPARGRKLDLGQHGATGHDVGLCSSTPRGDGNKHGSLRRKLSFCKVYAAQPREGTETRISSLVSICRIARFMQLNPARGRKHDEYSEWLAHYGTRFMQLNPARGRKL